MKILLIRYLDSGDINTRLPESINKAKGTLAPLGLAYIASYLEKYGYDVKILDAEILNLTSREARRIILREKADIVGITCMTSTFPGALEAARFAKESGAVVVLGGPQLNVFPEESVSYKFVDYGICGEGEQTMLELVQAIEKKKKLSKISKIQGLIYKKNKKVYSNPARLEENLDELPFPAWHLLPVKKYGAIIAEKPMVTMITSRGCPFQCGFCFKQPSDRKLRFRSPKNVVDEIGFLIEKYKIKEVMFYDDTLTLNREHIEGICKEILKRRIKIKWEGPTRIDCIDENLLRLMKKAGCKLLRYGVESGDPRILKLMRKNIDLERVKEVFKMSEKVGLETFAYFIIGYYSETRESMNNTINFAVKLNPDWAMFTIATPYPKTNLFDLSTNLIDKDYWKKYTLGEKVGRMPYLVKDAEKWAKKAYMRFYFRPRFILKKLIKLNSLDVLKNYIKGAKSILLYG